LPGATRLRQPGKIRAALDAQRVVVPHRLRRAEPADRGLGGDGRPALRRRPGQGGRGPVRRRRRRRPHAHHGDGAPRGRGGGGGEGVTQLWSDWRDRAVAAKAGVQATEATSVHRPIVYLDYDNLDEVTRVRRYDGDGVSVTVTGGVPDAPAASLLRAQAE